MNQTSILNFGPNSGYISELYELYLSNPKLVGEEWSNYFKSLNLENISTETFSSVKSEKVDSSFDYELQAKVFELINAYRVRGHLLADINPLVKGVLKPEISADLEIENYHFTSEDLEELVYVDGFAGNTKLKLRDLIAKLTTVYAGKIGIEYQQIEKFEERKWIESKFEQKTFNIDASESLQRLKELVNAEQMEVGLHRKYIGSKWFSLEGADAVIPMIRSCLRSAPKLGVREVIFGMAHRGRLNVLHNVIGKPLADIFSEFEDRTKCSVQGLGDVKYHLGYESVFTCDAGDLHLSLVPNPSHLEAVDPVLEGMTRAVQDSDYPLNRNSVLPFLIHGDAAIIGQGVVAETFNFSGVKGFDTKGTLHLVINNQIGFTATADEIRTSTYSTSFANAIQALVLHVNCEDLDAACWAINFALEYRQKFSKDVVIDLYAYRMYGHNEADDPTFTSPVIYSEIANKKRQSKLYLEKLINLNLVNESEYEDFLAKYQEFFEEQQELSKSKLEFYQQRKDFYFDEPDTGVAVELLKEVAGSFVKFPENFTPHPKLAKILEKRADSILSDTAIDWGTAEILAYGSLLKEGKAVRLSGQDCGRGTFSHRNILLTDYKTGVDYCSLDALETNNKFEVYNSVLSEAGVLSFEYGYSVSREDALVIWEAQFGDFVNGAQVLIDQFLSCAEVKWGQTSSLVLFLPHGYEGRGAEHSSAKLERFLQLCANENIQVACPTTAAQIFHLLRRQILTTSRKPLVLMTPKSLLRLPEASCRLTDLVNGSFQKIIVNDFTVNKNPKVILCSGKVYYDIYNQVKDLENIRLVRIEQLYPLPSLELKAVLEHSKEAIWVQEEHRNMGAWWYIREALIDFDVNLKYIGRIAAASPATGSYSYHQIEVQNFLADLAKIL